MSGWRREGEWMEVEKRGLSLDFGRNRAKEQDNGGMRGQYLLGSRSQTPVTELRPHSQRCLTPGEHSVSP